jgi:hypothetical protein
VSDSFAESLGRLKAPDEAGSDPWAVAVAIADRERRKVLGLTLAQRTSVSLGYPSRNQPGKNSASIQTLYRISLGRCGARHTDFHRFPLRLLRGK